MPPLELLNSIYAKTFKILETFVLGFICFVLFRQKDLLVNRGIG